MSGSSFPRSVADRVSAAFTLVTIIGLVWLIASVPQESGATEAPEHAVAPRQVDACDAGPAPGATDRRAQPEGPAGASRPTHLAGREPTVILEHTARIATSEVIQRLRGRVDVR